MSRGTPRYATRIEVLEAVQTHHTHAELADWIGICAEGVRYHLGILHKQGAVKRSGRKPVRWTITPKGRRQLGYARLTDRLGATT